MFIYYFYIETVVIMNKTVQLVNEWGAYEANHPEASVEDFCRFYLINEREKENREQLFEGTGIPQRPELILSKLLGRIMRMFSVYAEDAIKTTGLKRADEFYFLAYIDQAKNPRKTEVIYSGIIELSTGLSILEQLKKAGFIEEKDDPEDKRSKRVNITSEGKAVLFSCYEKFRQVGDILFGEMATEDMQLCIQLLQPIDTRHISQWQQNKGKPFGETYESMTKGLPADRKTAACKPK